VIRPCPRQHSNALRDFEFALSGCKFLLHPTWTSPRCWPCIIPFSLSQASYLIPQTWLSFYTRRSSVRDHCQEGDSSFRTRCTFCSLYLAQKSARRGLPRRHPAHGPNSWTSTGKQRSRQIELRWTTECHSLYARRNNSNVLGRGFSISSSPIHSSMHPETVLGFDHDLRQPTSFQFSDLNLDI